MKQIFVSIVACILFANTAFCDTRTWDGRHDTTKIEVTIVYFVPADRSPLLDWKDRVDYYARRIEQFHQREFQTQSSMRAIVRDTPLISELTTDQLRNGDANAIFFRTLREADRRLKFAQEANGVFSILLVLSEINWRPLDDFYRLHPVDGRLEFEGNLNGGQHFPGATSGGARATYLADRGVGWGLVSADGWRVPYRGSDCVVYHEGCGHTVGLPHPEPSNNSVMSMGQYNGWISESSVDKEQKIRLGWEPPETKVSPQLELFSAFTAVPNPLVPKPNESVRLNLSWPEGAEVKSLRLRCQTAIDSPWIEVAQKWDGLSPEFAVLPAFERATPVSYRIDTQLKDGSTAELWGYFQIRSNAAENPIPTSLSPDLIISSRSDSSTNVVSGVPGNAIDLLSLVEPQKCFTIGNWTKTDRVLESPKGFGARLELPFSPPAEYRMVVILEPLDPPNGFLLGQRSAENRFVTLFNYRVDENGLSAIENVNGRNVGNETTFSGNVFRQNQLAQVITTVRNDSVSMAVDGRTIVFRKGSSQELSLSDYWATPNDAALFIGAYDCRYRIHRMTLEPLSGEGKILRAE